MEKTSHAIIDGCLIYNNSTIENEGGGIRVASNNGNSSATIINSTITDNYPDGVHAYGTIVNIINSLFGIIHLLQAIIMIAIKHLVNSSLIIA